jgi:adenylate kinase family enzyme
VYALVGESGSGKSFRAKLVAQKYRADFIIDDGLLIKNNHIVAGHSAKKEKTFMAAVKVALFDEKSQRDEVARKLQGEKSKKLLILGTSEKMVNKIAARLQLPPPSKIIKIEDIASQADIENAIRARRIEGKHVIPVPSVEVKRSYPLIFYDAIRIFKRNQPPVVIGSMPTVHEKSVVRPEYSRRNKVTISEAALSHMALHCVNEYDR